MLKATVITASIHMMPHCHYTMLKLHGKTVITHCTNGADKCTIYLLTYLLYGAGSFLRSEAVCS